MRLHSLAKVTQRKRRRGRGIGSQGAKSGRGMKGQGARAGTFTKAGFEGGQTPLYMRFPKGRGTKQRFRSQVTKPEAVSLRQLAVFAAGTIVGPSQLRDKYLLSRRAKMVKIIAGGSLPHALTLRVHAATPQARAAVEAAGGSVEIIT